jgi:Tol biopolymer transport system component
MYLADLRSTPPRGVPFAPADGASHPGWTPDGEKIAVALAWTEYRVVDGQGRLIDSLAQRTMSGRRIGEFARGIRGRSEAFYGTYSPDGRWIAIATRASKETPGELFLMNATDGSVRRLCRTDYFGRHTAGAPRIAFVGNTGKILLSTDASWGRARAEKPQLYLVDPGSGAAK